MPIGQLLSLVVLFSVFSAAFLSLTEQFLVVILAVAFGGVCAFLSIHARQERVSSTSVQPIVEEPLQYHRGIAIHHIPVEGAVGLLFVVATVLIFAVGVRQVREVLLFTVPLGIVGGGLLLYWHKHSPVKFQRLGLRNKH
jgi:hypothetical protein